ncbi:MAG: SBBP repeat-containing protein [Candidatus Thorarchaeota archaeon]
MSPVWSIQPIMSPTGKDAFRLDQPTTYNETSEALENLTDLLHPAKKSQTVVNEQEVKRTAQELLSTQVFAFPNMSEPSQSILAGSVGGLDVVFRRSRVEIRLDQGNCRVALVFPESNPVEPVGVDTVTNNAAFIRGGQSIKAESYASVLYEEIWPDTSIYFRLTMEGLKYEIRLDPDADPSNVAICYEGAQSLEVKENAVTIHAGSQILRDEGLMAVQDGREVSVSLRTIDDTTVGFVLGNYDEAHPLVIDPLIFSTYVGGLGGDSEQPTGIQVDDEGCAYVVGYTTTHDFPTLDGYDSTYNGGTHDCFVLKLNSTGNGLVYSTLIGGSGDDHANDVAIDSTGNVYVCGYTYSSDFPTCNAYDSVFDSPSCFVLKLNETGNGLCYSTFVGIGQAHGITIDSVGNAYVTGNAWGSFPMVNAYDSTPNGSNDVVVFKLNATGNGLLYSTYVGGTYHEFGRSIALTSSGSVLVGGETTSSDFPMVDAINSTYSGASDCFLFELGAGGDSLLFSTYIGGSGDDFVNDIDLDGTGNVYVVGHTWSPDFPVVNATYPGFSGESDAFVAKINTAGRKMVFSTFLGGDYGDRALGIDVGANDTVFVVGTSSSPNFPLVSPLRTQMVGNEAFLARLNGTGGIVYSTFIGGSGGETAYAVAVDLKGNVHVAGETSSEDFPLLTPLDSQYDPPSDCFVLKMNSTGTGLNYSTYIGGSGGDVAYSVAVDQDCCVYVVGATLSGSFPVFNAYQDTKMGGYDCFVLKFDSSGRKLLYSTLFGGAEDDWATAIALDDAGNAYVTGYTESTDFPVLHAYSDSHRGATDCFVLKLNSTGNGLVYSTFVGGASWEYAYDIAVDGHDCTYVTGTTISYDFPIVGGFDSERSGTECFILKLNATGNGVVYSTYLGGSDKEQGRAIEVDRTGNAYVTGYTYSDDFPTTSLVWNRDPHGSYDCFVAKINVSGSGLVFSTYVGGNNSDFAMDLALYPSGEIWVVGETWSDDFPHWGNLDEGRDNGVRAFVFMLSPAGESVLCSSFLGGNSFDTAKAVAIDAGGNIFVVGETFSYDFPLLYPLDASQSVGDAFLVKIHFNMTWGIASTWYSTYLGGTGQDDGLDVAVDRMGRAYVVGQTKSEDLPVQDAYDSSYNGADCFVAKVQDPDRDGDGLDDGVEMVVYGTDPLSNDTDSDGMPDGWEVTYGLNATDSSDALGDLDGDMLNNLNEYAYGAKPNDTDSDDDGLDDWMETDETHTSPATNDTDSDGMSDSWEFYKGLDPNNASDASEDPDSDGLTNLQEFMLGSNPKSSDTDSDGIPDKWEADNGLDPTNSTDANYDPDGDGANNLDEYNYGTDPHDNDTDDDGINDWPEIENYHTDPLNNDTDGDGLSDYDEIVTYGTNATLFDTDSDTMDDGWEVNYGLNPFDPADADQDTDGDALSNKEEYLLGTSPTDTDTDNDGLRDGDEVQTYGSDPLDSDTDGDGMPDGWEASNGLDPTDDLDAYADADSDGLANLGEYVEGLDPNNNDTDDDGMPDGWEICYNLAPGNPSDAMLDYDDDMLTNVDEFGNGTDPRNNDSDSDGMPDGWEVTYGLEPARSQDASADADNDGLTNIDEYRMGTEPNNNDTDDDGMPDGWEAMYGLNPTYPGDGDDDADLDALCNRDEYLLGTNPLDTDSDKDGLHDGDEVHTYGTNPASNDTDQDRLYDWDEIFVFYTNPASNDTDDDGMPDGWEIQNALNATVSSDAQGDPDFDSLVNVEEYRNDCDPHDNDTDDDTMPDGWEVTNGLNPTDPADASADDDGDGFTNAEEYRYDCDPHDSDTDDDGMPDMWELTHSLDPNNPNDSQIDPDGDGLTNVAEYEAGTDPHDDDSDNDLMPDGWEVEFSLDPLNPNDAERDADIDGLSNREEYVRGTLPNNADSDGDGMPDGWEVRYDFDPLTPDGTADSDNDGLMNAVEFDFQTDPRHPDSDSDGLSDGDEVLIYYTNPLLNDTDGDHMLDGWEVTYGLNPLADDAAGDLDGDGLSNVVEFQVGSNPTIADTDTDGLSDGAEVNTYGSDPVQSDTNSNGIPDGIEAQLGLQPAIAGLQFNANLVRNVVFVALVATAAGESEAEEREETTNPPGEGDSL